MADTATPDTGLLPRTYFKAPRVPLDLRALLIALVGYGVYRLGAYLLWLAFKPVDPVQAFFREALSILDVPYIQFELGRFVGEVFLGMSEPQSRQLVVDAMTGREIADGGTFWHALVGGAWTLAAWGFFAQAIHRITSLRIARDEGMSLKDGVRFSIRNFVTIALCPVIVFVAIGIFYGCNALAGLVLSVPVLGSIASLILVPLAVISTLLMLLIAIGGAIGLPLVGAAAAWERNGSLDAISRAFSYIFARPLQFFWNYFLILLFTTIILSAGTHFETILTKSIDAGLLSDQVSVVIDTPKELSATDKAFDKLNNDAKNTAKTLEEKTDRARPFALSIKSLPEVSWMHWLTVLVFWVVLNVVKYGVFAVALWWFFGATTCTYADLRADVDGTDEDEIYLEEEEEDFEAMAKPDAPATPAPASPPSSPPPAAPPSGPAPTGS